jgi:hypothetical protein
MKLTKKLPNGKFQVNKAAVIAKLRKSLKAKHEALALGVIQVGDRETASVVSEMTKYNVDNFINTNEE